MNIGIIIPTTTNNTNWKTVKETHLYNIFLKSFLHKMCPKYNYRIYLGIDSDDKIYSKKTEIDTILKFQEVFKNIKIIFVDMKGIKKGWVTQMWNRLFLKMLMMMVVNIFINVVMIFIFFIIIG